MVGCTALGCLPYARPPQEWVPTREGPHPNPLGTLLTPRPTDCTGARPSVLETDRAWTNDADDSHDADDPGTHSRSDAFASDDAGV